MANTKTLSELRDLARQRADMERSQFVTDDEFNTYINDSCKWLHNLLVDTYADEYFYKQSSFTTVGGQAEYDLPNDFFKLLGVDAAEGSSPNSFLTVKKYAFHERNSDKIQYFTNDFRYRLRGDKIHFVPTPSGSSQSVRLHYIPCFELLEDDDDELMAEINGYAELVVIDAAIKALRKEESDTAELMGEKQQMISQIQGSAINRDAGFSERIVAIEDIDYDRLWR